MGMTGIEIYKLLPQTNCGDCGVPTCLAFAMKLAAGQAELVQVPARISGIEGQAGFSIRAPGDAGHYRIVQNRGRDRALPP